MIRVKCTSASFIMIDETPQSLMKKHEPMNLEAMLWKKRYFEALNYLRHMLENDMGKTLVMSENG